MNDSPVAVSTPPMRRGGRVAVALLFWTAIGFVFALPGLAKGGDWSTTLRSSLAQWWAWGLLVPLIVGFDRRLPFKIAQASRRLGAHLAFGFVATTAFVWLSALLGAWLRVEPWARLTDVRLLSDALGGYAWGMLVYCLIVGAWLGWSYHHRTLAAELHMERLQRSYSEARLNTLRMQLDPHFLFNALNTISAQLQAEPRLARTMIEHLGDLLRLSLDPASRHDVALTEELAFLDHYLAIQKIRFGDRLRFTLAVTTDARRAIVPSLFMQPLVENAIRHGIASRARGGSIRVEAEQMGERLDVRVIDDGVGLPAGWSMEHDAGLGLSVTRERIAGFHPEGATRFSVSASAGGGTQVDVSFPYRVMKDAHGPACE